MSNDFFYSKSQPIRLAEISPPPTWILRERKLQAELLAAAESGDEVAMARLKARGLKRWEKRGRRIL